MTAVTKREKLLQFLNHQLSPHKTPEVTGF